MCVFDKYWKTGFYNRPIDKIWRTHIIRPVSSDFEAMRLTLSTSSKLLKHILAVS